MCYVLLCDLGQNTSLGEFWLFLKILCIFINIFGLIPQKTYIFFFFLEIRKHTDMLRGAAQTRV